MRLRLVTELELYYYSFERILFPHSQSLLFLCNILIPTMIAVRSNSI